MKQLWKNWLAALILAMPLNGYAAGGGQYEHVEIDLGDQVSLQRGAQIFTNYCLSCHSASGMRYNRLQDLGLSEEEIRKNLMFTTDKIGDVMQSSNRRQAWSSTWYSLLLPSASRLRRV